MTMARCPHQRHLVMPWAMRWSWLPSKSDEAVSAASSCDDIIVLHDKHAHFLRSFPFRPFLIIRSAASLDAGLGRIPFVLQTIWVLLLASFLSLWRLGAADLWVDEAISYWIARKPLLELLTYSLSRAWEHPPVYYVLLRLWMGLLGDSEFALRAFSWFGMVLAVTTIATLARRWFGDRIALAAALIAATNPMMVKHARDARMYIWLMALVVLSVYAFDRALLRNRWRDWALFLGVLALAVGCTI